MNSKELLETYPKAADVVRKHFMEKLLESLNDADLPDDFKEFARQQEIDNEKISGLIDGQPRGLFDVFDAHEINVIIHAYIEEPPTEFGYSIPQEGDKSATMDIYQTRKEAEIAAIEKAFEILNEKL
jgi:hypothetical protein